VLGASEIVARRGCANEAVTKLTPYVVSRRRSSASISMLPAVTEIALVESMFMNTSL
jgi:hypothetical protein